MWRSRSRVHGEWKTCSVRNSHELRTLAPLGLSHCAAPFFATTKVPSMKHSAKIELASLSQIVGQRLQNAPEYSCIAPSAESPEAGRYSTPKRLGRSCPRRTRAQHPQDAVERLRGRPCAACRARQSCAAAFGSNGSMAFHCSSFSSSRRGIGTPQHATAINVPLKYSIVLNTLNTAYLKCCI